MSEGYAKVCESCTKPCKQASWCEILQCGHYEMSQEWAAEHERQKQEAKKQRQAAKKKRAKSKAQVRPDELQQQAV